MTKTDSFPSISFVKSMHKKPLPFCQMTRCSVDYSPYILCNDETQSKDANSERSPRATKVEASRLKEEKKERKKKRKTVSEEIMEMKKQKRRRKNRWSIYQKKRSILFNSTKPKVWLCVQFCFAFIFSSINFDFLSRIFLIFFSTFSDLQNFGLLLWYWTTDRNSATGFSPAPK